MLVAFFSWWYGPGWKQVANSLKPRLQDVTDSFSTRQLTRTLFSPWRRIITEPGRNIQDRWRAAIDNLFSRAIGFVVRSGVLFSAGVTLLGVAILTVAETVIWPLLPLAVPAFIILGLVK